MKFAIITPTMLRQSLLYACQSVESQRGPAWKHIIAIDQPEDSIGDLEKPLVAYLREDPQRHVSFCDRMHMNFGNTCRARSWEEAQECDYILYLDDDDAYTPGAFARLAAEIAKCDTPPVWGTYPIRFLGKRYHKLPPGTGNTFCAQLFHKPRHDDYILRFPDFKDQVYSADGLMADGLVGLAPHVAIDTDPIVEVTGVSGGYPRWIRASSPKKK